MHKTFRLLLFSSFAGLFLIICSSFVIAQNSAPPPPPPPPPRPMGVGSGFGEAKNKIPGATVRGRLVYEDSGLPVRYVSFGLTPAKGGRSYYSTQFVKTDENGDFLVPDVKAGDYYPVIKNDGILNPEAYVKLNRFDKDSVKVDAVFQKISVSGQGEFQIFVRAKRGTSMSGIIRYFDGEVAVDVKVEALRLIGDKYLTYPSEQTKTDDRGYYRFAGLPDGNYTIRVIEPVSHINKKASYYGDDYSRQEMLKTYYPQSPTAKDASGFELFAGQEQTGVNITLPERSLYDLSGMIVLKSTGEPLKNFKVDFTPIIEEKDEGLSYGNTGGGFGVGSGTGSSYGNAPNVPSEWALENLPKGKYRLVASQITIYGKKGKNQTKYPSVSKEIEITDGNIENIVFEIPIGGSVEGIVLTESGKPLPKYLRIYAMNMETKESESSDIDYSRADPKKTVTKKTFKINKLKSGKIKLNYSGRDFYIRSVSIGGRVAKDGIVELEDGDQLKNVEIVLASDLGVLKGKVNNFNPNDRTNILIVKDGTAIGSRPNSDTYFGNVDKVGNYQVKAKAGEYRVIVLRQSQSPKSQQEFIDFLKNAMETAPTVIIKNSETTKMDLN